MLKKEALALLIALILVPVVSAAPFQIYGELTPALPNKLKIRLAVNGTDVYNGVIKDSKFGYETPIMIEMGTSAGQRISIYISDVKVDEFQPQGSIVKRYIPISATLYEQITGKKISTGTATQGTSMFSSLFSSTWLKYVLYGVAGLVLLAAVVFLIYKIIKMPRKEKETISELAETKPEREAKFVEKETQREQSSAVHQKPKVSAEKTDEDNKDKSDPIVQLKAYVQRQAEAGKTKDEIKQKLDSVGWPEHVIEEVLETL